MRSVRVVPLAFLLSFTVFSACSSTNENADDPSDTTPTGGPTSEDGGSNSPNSPNSPDASQSPTQTDEGCGGSSAPPCADGKKCSVGKDCQSLSCQNGVCVAPTATDGVKNRDESDVDCGGSQAPACADGKGCAVAEDCESRSCSGGTCQPASATDGVKNGDETDVDCGGSQAPACADGKGCSKGADCTSLVCANGSCQPASATDGVKNGDESDVDCGGTQTNAPRCKTGATCKIHDDCASNGCDYAGKCGAGRSCTQHLGGDTCGKGEVDDPTRQHESCCATAPLAGSNARIDKYLITAGRMRAFIERLNGDVRTYAKTIPGWKTAWSALVPSTLDEANTMLGPYWADAPNDKNGKDVSKRSCGAGQFGGHTYWTNDVTVFTKDQLDPKALNCVGWHLVRAFCAWDGGRMITSAEVVNAFKNGGKTTYPWSPNSPNGFGGGETEVNYRLNHAFAYGYPGPKPLNPSNNVSDISWYVSPPGRFSDGYNANGVEIAGNLLNWTSGADYEFSWNFSWEKHGNTNVSKQLWTTVAPEAPNGYYAIGGRCVHD